MEDRAPSRAGRRGADAGAARRHPGPDVPDHGRRHVRRLRRRRRATRQPVGERRRGEDGRAAAAARRPASDGDDPRGARERPGCRPSPTCSRRSAATRANSRRGLCRSTTTRSSRSFATRRSWDRRKTSFAPPTTVSSAHVMRSGGRLERNLHDGAQQRLSSHSRRYGSRSSRLPARKRSGADRSCAGRGAARLGIAELRELARGLHP